MLILNIFYFLILLALIWFGSGLVVNSIDRLRKKIRYASFVMSFFILGMLTSLPELAIGLNAVSANQPEIFVGNLLGATAVIFLFIIPLLAILGNGIKFQNKLSNPSFVAILLVCLLPAFFILDKKITSLEAFSMVMSYVFAAFLMQNKYHLLNTAKKQKSLSLKKYSFLDIIKILSGIILIFLASQFIVEKTLYFSQYFQIAPFYISLMTLSLGTNLPEISIAIRAIISKKKEIALGNYLGSAAINTFLFGFLSILNNREVLTVNNFLITFSFIALGIILFYYFSKSHNKISRKEGLLLLFGYILFCIFELHK